MITTTNRVYFYQRDYILVFKRVDQRESTIEGKFGWWYYDHVFVSAGEISVDEVQAAMDEGAVAGDDEVIGEAESEDDDPDYAHPVGLHVVLDFIAEMRMCMENMFDAQDTRRTMIESLIQRIDRKKQRFHHVTKYLLHQLSRPPLQL